MLSYELCKKLRSAGLDQKLKKGDWYFYAKRKGEWLVASEPLVEALGKENIVKIPTLEELIEACGEKFAIVTKRDGNTDPDSWPKAHGPWMAAVKEFGGKYYRGYGLNPEEAVANLYLSLHSKP